MNAVMGFVSAAEQLQRVEAVRRRNAETTYERQKKFREQTNKSKADLEALLRGDIPAKLATKTKTGVPKLDAGQVENVAIPLGNSLEETLDLWREVRRDAYSEEPPTTADYQLGSKASARITEVELQLALHNRAKTIRDHMSSRSGFIPTESSANAVTHRMKTHYDQAFSAYGIQGQARANQYQVEGPKMNVSI